MIARGGVSDDIYVMDADGGNVRQLTDNPGEIGTLTGPTPYKTVTVRVSLRVDSK